MLEIRELTVEVEGRRVLKNLNLTIERGETHALLGPNGSGKTSLVFAVLGIPRYKVIQGKILFKGEDITNLPTCDRVKLGIGVAFQHPPRIRGVKLGQMVNICMGKLDEEVVPEAYKLTEKLKFPAEFLERDVNVGFSGGEMKKSEVLQLMAQNPDFIMLDEPDSGVDVDNLGLIGTVLSELLGRESMPSLRGKSGLIITHLGSILKYLKTDRAHVLLNGRIACSGYTEEVLENVMKLGYERCVKLCQKD